MKNPEEYTSLREEILQLINIQNNYIIAMYTISITILVFGIERKNEWIFMMPYIILLAFQRVISAKNNDMLRIAAYIAVYLENENEGWESQYTKIAKETSIIDKKHKGSLTLKNIIFGRVSSLQLGLVCSILGIVVCIVNNIQMWQGKLSFLFYIKSLLPVFILIILYFILRYRSKNALSSMEIRSSYINKLSCLKESEASKL